MLLFVVDGQTRSLSSMIEIAELVADTRLVVLVIQDVPEDCEIDGCRVGARERKDLNRARSYLADLVQRKGRPEANTVYNTVNQATVRAIKLAKECRSQPSLRATV